MRNYSLTILPMLAVLANQPSQIVMSFFLHLPGSETRARTAAAETHGAAVLSLADLKSVGANQADKTVLFLNDDVLDHVDLSPVLSALRPGGELLIRSRAQSDVKTSLFLSGFVDVAEGPASQPDEQVYVAHKPKWDVGAAAAVSVPVRAVDGSTAVSNSTKTSWKLVATDTAEDDLVDEDALLDDGLLGVKPKAAALSQDDCGTGAGGRKRACKDCTCGRAEMEVDDARVMTADELEASTSSCGNCYKGDAFRCGGCPFLGKPAFEPGQEKLVLKLDA